MAAGAPARDIEQEIPIIDVGKYLGEDKEASAEEARKVAETFHRFGIIILREPRVSNEGNERFLDMLEQYFEQPEEKKMEDTRPQLSYQLGPTPAFQELPRNHCDRMKAYSDLDKPLTACPPEKDAKWRFFWRIGERPTDTEFAELNAEAVIPAAFPQWKETMDSWGGNLLMAVTTVAEMMAVGFGLEKDTFTSRMRNGPHLLAPTATDFGTYGEKGTIAAGFHQDLNFFTIHGRGRFPGLYIWTRDGKKVLVRVPDGCLLVQAGMQAEYMTGGHVLAGFHEVVVCDETLQTMEARRAEGKSLWRISSTLFSHIASDVTLEPVGKFADEEPAKAGQYPPIKAGAHVRRELEAINLAAAEEKAEE